MNRVSVIVIPTIWKKALRYMIVGMKIVRGENGSVSRTYEGDQDKSTKETCLRKGGEHIGTGEGPSMEGMWN